jgi:hypothetical protein
MERLAKMVQGGKRERSDMAPQIFSLGWRLVPATEIFDFFMMQSRMQQRKSLLKKSAGPSSSCSASIPWEQVSSNLKLQKMVYAAGVLDGDLPSIAFQAAQNIMSNSAGMEALISKQVTSPFDC